MPERITKFKKIATGFTNYGYGDKGQIFFDPFPFSKTELDFRVNATFQETPHTEAKTRTLAALNQGFVLGDFRDVLFSKIHPKFMKLIKCKFERIQPISGIFCPKCANMEPGGGHFRCSKCGWENSEKKLAGYVPIEGHGWFTYHERRDMMHHFSLNKDELDTGSYVVSFFGLGYHYDGLGYQFELV